MGSPVQALGLVVVVAVVYALARRLGALPPLLLVVVGVVASYVPGVPTYSLDPELVLTLFLPPLLYAAAVQTSLPSFRANLSSIGLLAVGLVLVTTAAVAVVARALVPGLPWAAAAAIGAIVAPPDAVAATSIARRAHLPRRIVSILEGESLVNDATALTALKVAVAAVGVHAPSWPRAGLDFVVSAGGGVAVGVLTAYVVALLRRRTTDPVMDSTLSLLTPFAAYAAAERWFSGVLAVVVAGLLLGHRAPVLQSAQSRLAQSAIWRTIEFILQGVVFALVGLQLHSVLAAAWKLEHARTTVIACLGVSLAVVAVRPLWIFSVAEFPRLLRKDPARLDWRSTTVMSWAGMRGAVSLAAALSLKPGFPHRELLVLVAFVVIAVTLLLQGATLPWLIRALRLAPTDPVQDALAEAAVKQQASRAAEAVLDREVATVALPHGVEDRLRSGARARALAAWERLGSGPGGSASGPAPRETPSQSYVRVRRLMLRAEREVLVAARDDGHIDDEVLRRVQRDLDLEDALLSREDAD